MIRISISSSNYQKINESIIEVLSSADINVKIEPLKINRQYDVYVIEVSCVLDLDIIDKLNRNDETLIFVSGPESFEVANACIRKNVDVYLLNDDLKGELEKYKEDILSKIKHRFQYYRYKRNGIDSKIRLSQIEYIETLGHNIIIHSISGQFIERKTLSLFIEEIASENFTQIHKSYAVNKKMIVKMTNKEVILKNGTNLPIGRVYKESLKI